MSDGPGSAPLNNATLSLDCRATLISSLADLRTLRRKFELESPTPSPSSAMFGALHMRSKTNNKTDQSASRTSDLKLHSRACLRKGAELKRRCVRHCKEEISISMCDVKENMPGRNIYYSDKYYDDTYEYR